MIIDQNITQSKILWSYDKIYAKFEPIVNETLDLFSNEILFRINSKDNSHIKVLEDLRKNNESFSLFVRIIWKWFEEVLKTGNNLNINLEITDIYNINFIPYLETMLAIYSIDPTKINFEIVEDKPITDKDSKVVINNLKYISDLWFQIAIDDLYSWYSNKLRIDYLLSNWINISTVKIDGKFMKNMYEWYLNDFSLPDIITKNWEQIKRYTIDDFEDFNNYLKTLHSRWIKVVAEWIENEEMFEFAKKLWFDYFQWYYIQNINSNLSEI